MKNLSLVTKNDGVENRDSFGFKHTFIRSHTKPSGRFAHILELEDIQLRFNTRSDTREIRHKDGPWITCNTRLMSSLRLGIKENYGIKKNPRSVPTPLNISNTDWKMVLDTHDLENEVDPFIVWIESLPKWDKEGRIDDLLRRLFLEHRNAHVDSLKSEFTKWASRYMFIAPIQLAYLYDSWEPEDQIDMSPLFIGASGIGKSKMLRCLLPPEQPEWFTDSLKISNNTESMVEVLMGCVLVEIAELSGLSRADIEIWKGFSTRKTDRARLKYRSDAVNYPRKSVIIGTTNSMRCLPSDASGWRRDFPVLLGYAPQAVEPYIVAHRDQMWAEGLYRFKKGLRADMPFAMRQEAMKMAESFMRKNHSIVDAIANLPETFEAMTISDLILESGLVSERGEIHKLHASKVDQFVSLLYKAGCEFTLFTDKDGKARDGFKRDAENHTNKEEGTE